MRPSKRHDNDDTCILRRTGSGGQDRRTSWRLPANPVCPGVPPLRCALCLHVLYGPLRAVHIVGLGEGGRRSWSEIEIDWAKKKAYPTPPLNLVLDRGVRVRVRVRVAGAKLNKYASTGAGRRSPYVSNARIIRSQRARKEHRTGLTALGNCSPCLPACQPACPTVETLADWDQATPLRFDRGRGGPPHAPSHSLTARSLVTESDQISPLGFRFMTCTPDMS